MLVILNCQTADDDSNNNDLDNPLTDRLKLINIE